MMDETKLKNLIESLQKQIFYTESQITKLVAVAGEEGLVDDRSENENMDLNNGNAKLLDGPTMSDIKLMEKSTQWRILNHSCKTKILPDGRFMRQWSVSWQYLTTSIITIDQNITELVDGISMSTIISKLDIRILLTNGDDTGLIESETKELIDFCCEERNSSAFFTQMTSFQKLYNNREDAIEDVGMERLVGLNKSRKCIKNEIKNESGTLLATCYWWIRFVRDRSDFVEMYKVVFTDEGKKAGQDCNLPTELIDKGHCNWSPKECLKNLKQFSTFS